MTKRRGSGDRPIRTGPYPELTLAAVLVGYGLGIVITVSVGYACLILGFSHEGSELAAILGYGVLRGLMGRHSIVENNINQTVASAVNGASAGMMFSVPALFILGHTDFNPILMVFSCIAGGMLGIAFIIPLRKQMIDFERLTYPGGVAVATVLKSPGAGVHKAVLLVCGVIGAAMVTFVSKATGFEHWRLGEWLGLPEYTNAVWSISLLTVGVGFIAGRGGLCFVIGGYVCYWFLAPVLAGMNLLPSGAELQVLQFVESDGFAAEIAGLATNSLAGGCSGVGSLTAFVYRVAAIEPGMAEYLRLHLFRPVGIGMLVGGALTGIVFALPLIVSAVRSMQSAVKAKSGLSKDEMPIQLLYVGIVGAAVALSIVAVLSVEQMGVGRGVLMALLGTVWIWMAGVILSECIGRTNWSPMSGMTLIAVTILVLISSGLGDRAAIISSITVGAATCMAMAQATDLMLDLKTGYLVGATPRKQQIGQFFGAWLGPIVIIGLIYVLHKASGLGSEKLPAPQAQALASMIKGVLGGDVPVQKYAAGAGLGALLSATGIGGLGIQVGLGFYLPFPIVLTYTIGTALRMAADWRLGRQFSERMGIPIAAGLIVGEGLVGVGFAVYYILAGFAG